MQVFEKGSLRCYNSDLCHHVAHSTETVGVGGKFFASPENAVSVVNFKMIVPTPSPRTPNYPTADTSQNRDMGIRCPMRWRLCCVITVMATTTGLVVLG